MVNAAMAVVTGGGLRGVQPNHHLRPMSAFTQVFREAHERTFLQRLKLLDHLLSLVHRIEALDPKHDLDLKF